jgi:hypothetical protein
MAQHEHPGVVGVVAPVAVDVVQLERAAGAAAFAAVASALQDALALSSMAGSRAWAVAVVLMVAALVALPLVGGHDDVATLAVAIGHHQSPGNGLRLATGLGDPSTSEFSPNRRGCTRNAVSQ